MKTTILLAIVSLFLLVPVAYSIPVTHYYSGTIIIAGDYFSAETPFSDLVGQKFSGSFTYDSQSIGPYFPYWSNYYDASSASFHIGNKNFINYLDFDWQPLVLSGNDFSLNADPSETTHWQFDNFDNGRTSISFFLSFMGAPSGQFLYDSLKYSSLTDADFTEFGVTVYPNGQPYPLSRYLQIELVETIGPEIWDMKIYDIIGDIEYLSTTPVPEPSTATYLMTGLIPVFWYLKRIRTKRCT